jgi:hypothetical protein
LVALLDFNDPPTKINIFKNFSPQMKETINHQEFLIKSQRNRQKLKYDGHEYNYKETINATRFGAAIKGIVMQS